MLVPSTVHAFLVDWRVMVAAGSVLSTAMIVSLVRFRLLLEVYIMGGA